MPPRPDTLPALIAWFADQEPERQARAARALCTFAGLADPAEAARVPHLRATVERLQGTLTELRDQADAQRSALAQATQERAEARASAQTYREREGQIRARLNAALPLSGYLGLIAHMDRALGELEVLREDADRRDAAAARGALTHLGLVHPASAVGPGAALAADGLADAVLPADTGACDAEPLPPDADTDAPGLLEVIADLDDDAGRAAEDLLALACRFGWSPEVETLGLDCPEEALGGFAVILRILGIILFLYRVGALQALAGAVLPGDDEDTAETDSAAPVPEGLHTWNPPGPKGEAPEDTDQGAAPPSPPVDAAPVPPEASASAETGPAPALADPPSPDRAGAPDLPPEPGDGDSPAPGVGGEPPIRLIATTAEPDAFREDPTDSDPPIEITHTPPEEATDDEDTEGADGGAEMSPLIETASDGTVWYLLSCARCGQEYDNDEPPVAPFRCDECGETVTGYAPPVDPDGPTATAAAHAGLDLSSAPTIAVAPPVASPLDAPDPGALPDSEAPSGAPVDARGSLDRLRGLPGPGRRDYLRTHAGIAELRAVGEALDLPPLGLAAEAPSNADAVQRYADEIASILDEQEAKRALIALRRLDVGPDRDLAYARLSPDVRQQIAALRGEPLYQVREHLDIQSAPDLLAAVEGAGSTLRTRLAAFRALPPGHRTLIAAQLGAPTPRGAAQADTDAEAIGLLGMRLQPASSGPAPVETGSIFARWAKRGK